MVKGHPSPLHHLCHAFNIKPNLIEEIPVVQQHLNWTPGFTVIITQDSETAIREANNALEYVQIFTDRSHIKGKVGAVADLWLGNFKDTQARKHLGQDCHFTIFKVELIGIAMAIGIIWDRSFDKPVMIGTDSQAAIKVLQHQHPTRGSYLTDYIHSRIKHAQWRNAGLKIHNDVRRNEQVDSGAKEAARGLSSEHTFLHRPMVNLPTSLAVARHTHMEELKSWNTRTLRTRPHGLRLTQMDPSMPLRQFLKLIDGIPRAMASLIMQLHTGHVPLNANIYLVITRIITDIQQHI
jgi:ribonuclease HI